MNSDQVIAKIDTFIKEILHSGICKKGIVFPIDINMVEDEKLKDMCSRLAIIFEMMNESYKFADQLSQGGLNLRVSRQNIFAMPLKALQASLSHLNWQVNQVAEGDLNQKVRFLGSFSDSFNRMINALKEKKILEQQLVEKNLELEKSMQEIKTLRGIIPICMHCKSIRDDEGYWNKLEKYFGEHTDAKFSHGICNACLKKHYPEVEYQDLLKEGDDLDVVIDK